MKQILILLISVAATLVGEAQNYRPEDDAFVCENGRHRFTRALYGSPTDWRLETSDRPVFAVAKKGYHRNIRFVVNGIALDSTDYCKAWYHEGRRDYQLSDQQWTNNGMRMLRVSVVALPHEEGAVFLFSGNSAPSPLDVKVLISPIAQPKLSRNGDIGADKPGVFEAAGCPVVSTAALSSKECAAAVVVRLNEAVTTDYESALTMYQNAKEHFRTLASRIRFSTPDAYLNTLGGALLLAADGDWDGQTWLHGCIGWRMPLAGWRAAYAGDVLGWNNRAVRHFNAYAKSQVTQVPPTVKHPTQDAKMNMARAKKQWGTQMYSNGYICRNPERNDQMHHYDMNLNYIDELLWHFQYDADTAYMRQMWPVIQRHLAWEKRNFDPDGDHLYDAYCCIWASDALYYSGGAVTHSSAYNYRANRLAAKIARILGEDAALYQKEADGILQAMNRCLWLKDKGYWAEYQDLMGLKRRHESAAVWSIYTPIDCGACTSEQAFAATRYIDAEIPRIPVADTGYSTISTSNWLPYSWSINNVAAAEVMHTALAYYEAGRADAAFRLMKANILDQMYYGQSPANFGQISQYDAARGECYRDFGDCIGISARTLLQGLFGIVPQALDGRCIIRPGFPHEWDSASVVTPYLSYRFYRRNGKDCYEIMQNFTRPLTIIVRQNLGNGRFRDIVGTGEKCQTIVADTPNVEPEQAVGVSYISQQLMSDSRLQASLLEPEHGKSYRTMVLDGWMNDCVDSIFKHKYLSPRPPFTTLQIPVQGVGEWCHPSYTPLISDSVFRSLVRNGEFTVAGVPFRTPARGRNVIYTSLWHQYPDSITVPLSGKAEAAWLLLCGSSNHMQCHIANAEMVATYRDGTTDTLQLIPPYNWCPVEQDYYVDGAAFRTMQPRPYRVSLGTGTVSRDLGKALQIGGVYGREIPGGAAQMLRMPLNGRKKLKSLTLRCLSNDVVVGLMAVTLQ